MKLSRRSFVGSMAAAAATFGRWSNKAFASSTADLCQYVDPKIGTGGFGHCFPAATVPFGAVQLGPDTGDHDWAHCSGYHYNDDKILGFSHTHLSGTGVGDMQDFRVMPGYSKHHSGQTTAQAFIAHFSHAHEHAEPGYYRVTRDDSKIVTELTATERAGFHRYTFPEEKGCILLDLQNVWRLSDTAPNEPSLVRWARLHVQGANITGARSTNAWAVDRELYFSLECSVTPERVEIVADGTPTVNSGQEIRGQRIFAVLHFANKSGETILLKTGISGVDDAGAQNNLLKEIPDWDFEATRAKSHEHWNRELSRAIVRRGGDVRTKRIFYTSLYHAMLAPTLFDDHDGRYRGMDGRVHTLRSGRHNFSTFSLWDTYRALHPLFTLIEPQRVPDLVNCIIRQSTESPQGVTVWPLQGKETGCMVGYHSAPVVAEAINKHFSGIDVKAAYAAFHKRAEVDDYRGLADYRKFGYVPCDLQEESASKTCDYAYDDWCVASIADAAGQHQEAESLRVRSKSYRHLYDAKSGFIRPRYQDGHWAGPFDPKAITITKKWRDYTEANAWQTTFLVQHDGTGLRELLGGPKALEQKLDDLFNQSSDLPKEMMPPDITGMVGQYCQGNEPSHHIALYYNVAGVPHKAQARIHQLMTDLYHAEPDAMAGNEDCGQMSAWYCMNAFGFYPIDPTSGTYDIGTPLFDEMTLSVGNGKVLTIVAERDSKQSIYVHSVRLNGQRISGWTLDHTQLEKGGILQFSLKDLPPSNPHLPSASRTHGSTS